MDEDKLVTMYERESGEKRIDSNGNVVEHKIATYAVKKEKLANTGGTKLVKFKRISSIQMKHANTPSVMKLLAYVMGNQSRDSMLVTPRGKPASSAYLSEVLDIHRNSLTSSVKSLMLEGLLKKVGRTIYVNPYIIMPYAISNHSIHLLQLLWDNNFVPLEYEVDDRDGVEFLRDHLDGIE